MSPTTPAEPPADSTDPGSGPESRGLLELLRHTLNYGSVPVIHAAVSFGMLPLYTLWLSESEYGVIGLSDLILVILAELLGTHLLAGMVRHYFMHVEDRDRRAVVSSTTLLVMVLSWSICGLALWFRVPLTDLLLGEGSAEVPSELLTRILTIALLILPCQLTSQAGFSYLQAQKRSALFSGIKLVKLFFELGLKIWMLAVLGWGVEGFFLSVLIGEAITALILTGWMLSQVGLQFDMVVLRPVLRFMAPLVPVGVCQLGMHQLDKRLLEHFWPEDEAYAYVGIYALGYLIARMANQLVLAPFFTIWQPWVFDEQDENARSNLIGRVTTYAVVIITAASLGLITFGFEATQLLASRDGFKQAYKVIPWVTSAYVCWALYNSAQLAFLAARRTRPLMWINLAALVLHVLLNLWWIPEHGFMGCAAATLATFAALAAMAMLGSHVSMRIPFEWRRICVVLMATTAGAVGVSLIDQQLAIEGGWSLVVTLPIKLCLLLGLWALLWRGCLAADDRVAAWGWLRGRLARGQASS